MSPNLEGMEKIETTDMDPMAVDAKDVSDEQVVAEADVAALETEIKKALDEAARVDTVPQAV